MAEVIDLVAILKEREEQKERELREEVEKLTKLVDAWVKVTGANELSPYYLSLEEQLFLTVKD